MQEQRFRNKVNWISIICAVLVVFLHSFAFVEDATRNAAYHIEFFFSRNLAQASVPTFFALSGFLFYRNFSWSKLGMKFRSRLKSLVIPYVLWNIISMSAFYFLSKLPFINTEPFEWRLSTIVDGVVFYRYNLVFWFVQQLIILTFLFPLLYPIVKKKWAAVTLFCILIVLYGSEQTKLGFIEVKALIFYLFGVYFAVHHQQAVAEHNRATVWGVLCFGLTQLVIYSDYSGIPIVYIVTRILMIVAVFDLSSLLCECPFPAFLNCSFPIYAMHNLILESFNKVFSFFLTPGSNLILIDYFGSSILTILIIMSVNHFLLKKMPKLHGILFGGRGK